MPELKPMVRIVDNSKPYEEMKKDHEVKEYLICGVIASVGDTHGDNQEVWSIVTGRTEAYEFIKELVTQGLIMDESFILVEGQPLEKRKSIYQFMKYVEQYFDDSFDIDDYVLSKVNEEPNNNNIDKIFYGNEDKISMEDIMNGDITTEDIN